MSAGGGGEGGLDFDLNLAPIIDCFTVLITFMLVSASFLSVSILEAQVAPLKVETADESYVPQPPKGVSVSIQIQAQGEAEINVSGEENRVAQIARRDSGPDLDALSGELEAIRSKWPSTVTVTLSGENAVEYREIVRVMERLRKTVPNIQLGGF